MIVLDTHIWFWWINGDLSRLSTAQAQAVRASARVGVCAVSCYELANAVRRGRIELSMPMQEWFAKGLAGSRIELLPLTPEVAVRAVALTDRHRDPFDRIIIATAMELDAELASADGQFRAYPELAGRLLA
jgi:PIN domain nuclease of toxin-antitoxin system